jgi:methyl-accepting chemotaxis protein
VNSSTVDIATKWLPSVRRLVELRADMLQLRVDTFSFVEVSEKRGQLEERISADLREIADDQKTYEPMISSPEEQGLSTSLFVRVGINTWP